MSSSCQLAAGTRSTLITSAGSACSRSSAATEGAVASVVSTHAGLASASIRTSRSPCPGRPGVNSGMATTRA